MEKDLLKTIYGEVCASFGVTCDGCPFWSLREKQGEINCEKILDYYPKAVEVTLARFIAGDTVLDKPESQKDAAPETRREILQAAERCVCGDRDKTYKGPEDSFALIAELWEPIIKARCVGPGADVRVDAVTVALLMAELKIARAATNEGHMDSWVDLAGYAACGGEIAAKREKEGNI